MAEYIAGMLCAIGSCGFSTICCGYLCYKCSEEDKKQQQYIFTCCTGDFPVIEQVKTIGPLVSEQTENGDAEKRRLSLPPELSVCPHDKSLEHDNNVGEPYINPELIGWSILPLLSDDFDDFAFAQSAKVKEH